MSQLKERFKAKLSLLVLVGIIGWFSSYPLARQWGNPLSWDVFGYYLYLPANFIWHDAGLKDFSKVEEVNKKYDCTPTYYQGSFTEDGKFMIKYSCGVAVLESPFFFAAHLLAPSLGYPADGFSKPYQNAMLIANFFWIIIGFIFLRKALLKLFSDGITALLLALVMIGTNFYIIGLITPGMTHQFEFSLFAIILYLTILWHEAPSLKRATLLGAFIGLAIIVRPSDGVIILLPLLWNVGSWKELKAKVRDVFTVHRTHMLCLVAAAGVVGAIQMSYWKNVAGSALLFSYNNNPGEGFEFLSPYIVDVLFSFRKGWFIYTPLMLLAVAGIIMMWRKNRRLFVPLAAFLIVNVYVVSSWSCWWYAGSYGHRAMVDSYAVMMVPLGFFFTQALQGKTLLKITAFGFAFLFTVLNLFQSWQFSAGIISDNRMTAAYYWKVFGKTTKNPADDKYLLINRSTGEEEKFTDKTNYTGRTLFDEGFETVNNDLKTHYVDSVKHGGKLGYLLDSTWVYSPPLKMPYKLITHKDHAWIHCSFWFYPASEMEKNQLTLTIAFMHGQKAYKYDGVEMDHRFKDAPLHQWSFYEVDYLTPEVRSTSDELQVNFWLRGKTPVYVDDLKVEAYEPK